MSVCLCAKPIEVRVGGYVFEPYIVERENGQWGGLTVDLIDALNRQQNDYFFKLVHTSAIRRYDDFRNGFFDLIFFEDLKWGWKDIQSKYSDVFLTGGEYFVALKHELSDRVARKERDQLFFKSLAGKRVAGVRGFHYNFNQFRSTINVDRTDYEMVLAQNSVSCLTMILKDRADIAVVSRSLVNRFISENPQFRDTFIISKTPDQVYQHRLLIRDQAPIAVADIDAMMLGLKKNGVMSTILQDNFFSQHGK